MKHFLTAIAVAYAVILQAGAAHAATTTQQLTIDVVEPSPCGEAIHLTGTILAVFSVTTTPSGGFIATFHFNPQGVIGIGVTTGAIYHGTGVTLGTSTETGASTNTFVDSFNIIGTGSVPNLLEQIATHVIVDANGTATVDIDRASIVCV